MKGLPMKTSLFRRPALILGLALAAGAALAQTPAAPTAEPSTPRVDQRQENQARRIEKGTATGQLTPKEADKLQAQQGRIEKAEAQAKSDGKVTARERKRLDKKQDNASRKIKRERKDRQKAAAAPAPN